MRAQQPTILKTGGRRGWFTLGMLVLAFALYLAGLFRPFTEVTKMWIFESEVSVISGLVSLLEANEYFLFMILGVFTVAFPAVKMLALLAIWLVPALTRDSAQGMFRFVSHLGKWSMLDVFVVAILVILMRSGGIAQIEIRDGVVLFTCSVLLTQIAAVQTGRIVQGLKTD
ncbi:MAG TPA: paraquat-inducible protein A [Opitutaceae bacterium]|nr:paraquat-inducible protein A [Opitutaceae bacterium]